MQQKILFLRGNTAQSTAYTGLVGEITIDTTANSIRVHDNLTAGGHLLLSQDAVDLQNANISVLQGNIVTLTANAGFQFNTLTSLTANAVSQQTAIGSLTGTVATHTVNIAALTSTTNTLTANVATLMANAATQDQTLKTLFANVGYQNDRITTLDTTVQGISSTQVTDHNTLNTLSGTIGGYTANIASLQTDMQNMIDSASAQATDISALQTAGTAQAANTTSRFTAVNTAIATANTAMKGYVDTVTAGVAAAIPDVSWVNVAINSASLNQLSYTQSYTDAVTVAWTANAGAQADAITGTNAAMVTANTAMKGYVDAANTKMTSYVGDQITTANTTMTSYVDAVTTAWRANASSQAGLITTLQSNAGVQADAITAIGDVITAANRAAQLYTDREIITVNSTITNVNNDVLDLSSYVDATNATNATTIATKANIITPSFVGNVGVSGNINMLAGNVYCLDTFAINLVSKNIITGNVIGANVVNSNIVLGNSIVSTQSFRFANLNTAQVATVSNPLPGTAVYNFDSTGNLQLYTGLRWTTLAEYGVTTAAINTANTAMRNYVGTQITTANTAMTAYVDDVTFNWIVANIKQSDQISSIQSNIGSFYTWANTTPNTASNTSTIATTAFVQNVVPTGGIVLWHGSNIAVPYGWRICDGTNGTPTLSAVASGVYYIKKVI